MKRTDLVRKLDEAGSYSSGMVEITIGTGIPGQAPPSRYRATAKLTNSSRTTSWSSCRL